MRVKGPVEFNFQAFTESEIKNLSSGGHHCAASKIYCLRYKTLVLSYSPRLKGMNHVKLCM